MARALIMVDYQNEWSDRKSDYYIGRLNPAIAVAKRVLAAAREKGFVVIYTQHIEPEPTVAFKRGTKGAAIIDGLSPVKTDKVVVKNRISPFYRTGLDSFIAKRRIREIAVCGIMTNLCVRSTVSDAYDRDISVTVISDACASDSARTDRFTFDDIRRTRPEVRIITSREFIRSLG